VIAPVIVQVLITIVVQKLHLCLEASFQCLLYFVKQYLDYEANPFGRLIQSSTTASFHLAYSDRAQLYRLSGRFFLDKCIELEQAMQTAAVERLATRHLPETAVRILKKKLMYYGG
jgi:hypothetical protein